MDIFLIPTITFIIGATVSLIISAAMRNNTKKEFENSELRIKELEKQIHLEAANHLKLNNSTTRLHHEELNKEREKAEKEGFEQGVASCKKDHQIEITNLRSEHRDAITKERLEAEERGKKLAKAEIEAQTKAFSVLLRPYIKIEKNNGLIWSDHRSHTGYQYQLLINGIPAFQPHIFIEKTETIKSTDKETVKELIQLAQKSVEGAINIYLNGATNGMLKVGGEIIDN